MSRTIGVIGLGSMGKRRVRDLVAAGYQVVGFDVREDRNAEASRLFGVETVSSFEALIGVAPAAMVISTPPDTHVAYYEKCFGARLPFFSEANLFTPPASWFAERSLASGIRGVASATWRFHPVCALLKQRVDELGLSTVRTVSHQYGGYLPDWHPWEPYDAFYAGRRRTSASREMVPFEGELLLWVFGPVERVCAIRARRAEWRTAIDDTYMLLLHFANGIEGVLSIELHQVQPFRIARVSLDGHSLTLDLGRHELEEYSKTTDTVRRHRAPGLRSLSSFHFEDVYRAEITAFADHVFNGGGYEKTWEEDRHLSSVLWAAEESARRREWITIGEAEASHDGMSWTDEPNG